MRSRPRYRLRTWLREHLPELLAGLLPPGRRDCGDHEWFRADEETDRCWHCVVGERPHQPVPIDPDSSVWQALRKAAREGDPGSQGTVLRIMAEHEAYEAMVVGDMRETAFKLDVDASTLERQASLALEAHQSLAAAAQRIARVNP
jgi:hypothetical protein